MYNTSVLEPAAVVETHAALVFLNEVLLGRPLGELVELLDDLSADQVRAAVDAPRVLPGITHAAVLVG